VTDPRVERTRAMVLDATGDLVAEAGVAGFNVDAVAKRAGVARTTIYRHWPDPNQLLFDTFACMGEKLPHPETGDLAADLTAGYGHLVQALAQSEWGRMLPAMLDATFRDPALTPLLQAFTDARRQPTRDVIGRAIERGDLPADVDVERIIDRIAGPIFYRYLVLQQPYGTDDVAALVADVLVSLPRRSTPVR
jgi:AcrR family transcriptional regulator